MLVEEFNLILLELNKSNDRQLLIRSKNNKSNFEVVYAKDLPYNDVDFRVSHTDDFVYEIKTKDWETIMKPIYEVYDFIFGENKEWKE